MYHGKVVLAGRVTVLSLRAPEVDTSYRAGVVAVFELEAAIVWVMEYGVLVLWDRLVVDELICENVLIEVPFWRPPKGGIDSVEVGVFCVWVEEVGLVARPLVEALTEAS